MSAVLTLGKLHKVYGRTVALDHVDCQVGAGQVFGLLGPNGSGKTTALGIALGAVRPSGGRCQWFGQDASAKSRLRVGALLEQPVFYPWLSGADNLRIFAAIKGVDTNAAEDAFKAVGLWDARRHLFQSYSLGMKQRLGLALALLGRPEVLVLDEPTNGVDAQGIADIRGIIHEHAKKGITVILASHILDEVEKVSSHIAIIKKGRLIRSGAIHEVLGRQAYIELRADDMGRLQRVLLELLPASSISIRDGSVVVSEQKYPSGELNQMLATRGVYLSHLALRRPSLEREYLDAVEGG